MRPSRMMATVSQNESASSWLENGSSRRTLRLERPSRRISPAYGCSKPAIIHSVVVLPRPLGPTNGVKKGTVGASRKAIGSSFIAMTKTGASDVPGAAR